VPLVTSLVTTFKREFFGEPLVLRQGGGNQGGAGSGTLTLSGVLPQTVEELGLITVRLTADSSTSDDIIFSCTVDGTDVSDVIWVELAEFAQNGRTKVVDVTFSPAIAEADSSPYTVVVSATTADQGVQSRLFSVVVTPVEKDILTLGGIDPSTQKLRLRYRYDPQNDLIGWNAGDAALAFDEIDFEAGELDPYSQGDGTYRLGIFTSTLTPNLAAAVISQEGWYDLSVSSFSDGEDTATAGEYLELGNVYLSSS
jgi:hypothetical protein